MSELSCQGKKRVKLAWASCTRLGVFSSSSAIFSPADSLSRSATIRESRSSSRRSSALSVYSLVTILSMVLSLLFLQFPCLLIILAAAAADDLPHQAFCLLVAKG